MMDTSKTDGSGKGSIGATAMTGFYYRTGTTAYVGLTFQSAYTLGTFGTGNWAEVSQGLYSFGVPNAVISSTISTHTTVVFLISTAAGAAANPLEIQLTSIDWDDSTRSGITALPTSDYNTVGGLAILGTQIPTASFGFTNGLPIVGKQIPTATAGAVGGLIMIGDQVPTASAGLSSGLPTVGKQIPTGTAGAVNGLPLLGLQIPTASAGQVSAGLLTGTSFTAMSDNLLDRDLSLGTDSGSATFRTTRQALRFIRNKWIASSSTLTVYKEDDTTVSWTAILSSDAAAVPIVGNDPAG